MKNRQEIQRELDFRFAKLSPLRHRTPLNDESTKVMLLMEMMDEKINIIEALETKIETHLEYENELINVINRKEMKQINK